MFAVADGHGGHRTPNNPAPASGPGRLSKRTDGGPGQKLMAPTGMDYGQHKALMDQERTSAMSQAPTPPTLSIPQNSDPGSSGGGNAAPGFTPLDAPSQRPDEPVSHGAALGPGAGAEALGTAAPAQMPDGSLTRTLQTLSPADATGLLADLYLMAQQRGV